MALVYGSIASTVTWDAARTRVRGDLWRTAGSLSDDSIDRGIHAALRRLEAERRWQWLEKIEASLVADVDGAELDRPATLRSIASLAYISPPRGYTRLTPAPLSIVRANAADASFGSPSMYALAQDKIYVDTPVKAGDTFEVIFKAGTPLDLAQAMLNPPVTLSLQLEPVIAAACAHVALVRLKNETEAARHEGAYHTLLQTLFNEEDETRSDQAGGGIVPDTALYRAAYGGWGN
jgi:hypothetical protein